MIQMNSNYTIRKIMGETLLFPTNSEIQKFQGAIRINEVTEYILGKLNTPSEIDNLIESITSEYNVDYDTASKDLRNIVDSLLEMGVIYKL